VLGWKTLDQTDGGGILRLEIGALVGVGIVLALITAVRARSPSHAFTHVMPDRQALGAATAGLIKAGHLTVDRERVRSLARAQEAVETLRRAGKPVPSKTLEAMTRWQTRRYFWVPDSASPEGGKIVEYKGAQDPYDHGPKDNWDLVMGRGRGWLLPWRALRRGMTTEETLNWPIGPEAGRTLSTSTATS
jgi:palmitoyltransferase